MDNANFSHLSVQDLIEARDQFHVHLMNKKNVVATAIGRYLIRRTDIDDNGKVKPSPTDRYIPKPARTLDNSMIIDVSWPCVLVFVDKWEDETALVLQGGNNIVPKTIYMPDGRVIPVCIVEAPKQAETSEFVDPQRLRFPDNLIGGGFPLLMHSQGVDWVATVGCVVADGHRYYALTNKHVTGEGGETVYTRFGGSKQRIGVASGLTLGKVEFSKLYEDWKCKDTFVNCDVGLVEIDDLNRWKTDVLGIGQIGELYDLNTHNITLNLLAEHSTKDKKYETISGRVKGYGAVSGLLKGELLALFYRHKSVGGREYVSDFLIGGRGGKSLNVHHGDSGTLWLLETVDEEKKAHLQPIALHWGQHEFVSGKSKKCSSYSLATALSTVCRELDVELIRDWNIGQDYSWGKVGHYTVGSYAVDAVALLNASSKLGQFMSHNLANISFPKADVTAGLDDKNNPALSKDPTKGFCALSDVPDIIWKQSKKTTTWGRMGDENPNHYADADAPTTSAGHPDLFAICAAKSDLTTKVWSKYYDDIDKAGIGMDPSKPVSQGLISFRVWQIFQYMVDALGDKSAEKFMLGAGVLSHYVGDGCQPLHSSYMSNGDPADDELVDYTAKRDSPAGSKNPHKKGDVYKKIQNPGNGVHVAYEDKMVDAKIDGIKTTIQNVFSDANSRVRKEVLPVINDGQSAGFAVLQLMKLTQADIHPRDIVEAYKTAMKNGENVSNTLYESFGTATGECIARGAIYLAAIWKAAWEKGNGDLKLTDLTKVDPDKLRGLYKKPTELPSMHLDTIDTVLTGNASNAAAGTKAKKKAKKKKAARKK